MLRRAQHERKDFQPESGQRFGFEYLLVPTINGSFAHLQPVRPEPVEGQLDEPGEHVHASTGSA